MSLPLPIPSTFMPLPLPMMIPFMGVQSAIMALQFGTNFQYGKRKISAMSNEEFNKLTPLKILEDHTKMMHEMIPTIQESIRAMRPMTEFILKEFMLMFRDFVNLAGDVAANVPPKQIIREDTGITGRGGPNRPTTVPERDANEEALKKGEKFQPPEKKPKIDTQIATLQYSYVVAHHPGTTHRRKITLPKLGHVGAIAQLLHTFKRLQGSGTTGKHNSLKYKAHWTAYTNAFFKHYKEWPATIKP